MTLLRSFLVVSWLLGIPLVSPAVRAQTLECAWSPPPGDAHPSHVHVAATVAVAYLSDDNGDGDTDSLDFPDLVFASATTGLGTTDGAVIRVVDGRCNGDGTMRQLATLEASPLDLIDKSSAVAIGNLHSDTATTERAPEIVAALRGGKVAAWRRTSSDATSWQILWVTKVAADQGTGVQPSIADLNGDGDPEVVVGGVLLNGQTGDLIWDRRPLVGADSFGAVSTVADWNLDGAQEVIVGPNIYGFDGQLIFSALVPDGYTAVANFNPDAFPELVHVNDGLVRVVDQTGTHLLLPLQVPGGGRAGPPTIADLDGDGAAEIGVVGQHSYAVMDFECLDVPLPAACQSAGIRWSIPIQELTSGGQSASAFDLDGDGAAELAFLDESFVYVVQGLDGKVLFQPAYPSNATWLQYPVMADIDADGVTELIVPSALFSGEPTPGGVQIWSDPSWSPARGTWNQYSYSVTNVDDEGQIPAVPAINWLDPDLNNFRANHSVLPPIHVPTLSGPALWIAPVLLGVVVTWFLLRRHLSVGCWRRRPPAAAQRPW